MDLAGRTIVVTGANSGIGLPATRELASRGAHVVMACRDPARAAAAVDEVRSTVGEAELSVVPIDLADQAGVRAAAAHLTDTVPTIDVLVNNAGVMAVPRRVTVDGFELQFATNHLGHFALTGLLLPTMLDTPGSRVVTVTSMLYRHGRLDLDDLQSERRYNRWRAYAASKLANLLFTHELQRRLTLAAAAPIAVACHPGYVATRLQDSVAASAPQVVRRAVARANRALGRSPEQGARALVMAVTDPGLVGAELVGPKRIFGTRGEPTLLDASDAARDARDARGLWERSVELTGVDPLPDR